MGANETPSEVSDLRRLFAYDVRRRVAKGEDVTKDLNKFFSDMTDMVLEMNEWIFSCEKKKRRLGWAAFFTVFFVF